MEEKEIKYPIIFDKCPVCGGSNSIVQRETDKEIELGNLGKGAKIPALVTQSRIFDPSSNVAILAKRNVTVLTCYYDICTDCGTFYCREVQKQIAVMEPRIKGMSNNGDIDQWKN